MEYLEFLRFGFMQRALLAGVLVSVAAGVIGTFIVLRGMSLLGDSLAHASFGGVALGLLLGVAPLPVALATAVIGGLAVHVLEHRGVTRGDTALGIVFAGGLGLGVIVISVAGGFNVGLLAYLFGSILAVRGEDVVLFGLLTAVLMVAVVGLFKEYLYLTFDEETAEASGLPTHALNVLFAVLTAVAVVAAIKLVGVLLVSALLIVPAATSQYVSRSFRQTLSLAVVLAATSMVLGIVLAYYLNWPPGGAVVAVSLTLFATLVGTRRTWEWVAAA